MAEKNEHCAKYIVIHFKDNDVSDVINVAVAIQQNILQFRKGKKVRAKYNGQWYRGKILVSGGKF